MLVIDPPGCGCTECLTGEYKPLETALPRQVLALAIGVAVNNTGLDFVITADLEAGGATRITAYWRGEPVAASYGDPETRRAWETVAKGWELR